MKVFRVGCCAFVFCVLLAISASGADMDALKTAFDAKKAEFDTVSNAVYEEFDKLLEKETDNRMKAELTMVRYALKENNHWAGRIDAFGKSGYSFDPYQAESRSEPLKSLTKYQKMAVQLKVPVALLDVISTLSGTMGLEEILDKCHFCPEAGQAKETFKGEKEEFPAGAGENPFKPLALDDPTHKAVVELLKKNRDAYRALYDAGETFKEKILRLRPPAGFKYSDESMKEFKQKMEELYKEKPEYKTEKASPLEEAQTIAKITGLPEEDLCKYQSYNGTMGLQKITFSVPDVQFKPFLEIFFGMIGL